MLFETTVAFHGVLCMTSILMNSIKNDFRFRFIEDLFRFISLQVQKSNRRKMIQRGVGRSD